MNKLSHVCFVSICFFLWPMNCSNTVGNYGEKTSSLNFIARSRESMEIYLVVESELPMTWCHGGGKTWRRGHRQLMESSKVFEVNLWGRVGSSHENWSCFLGFLMFSQVGMAKQPGLSIQTWWYSELAPCVWYIALHNVNEHLCFCIYPKQWNTFFQPMFIVRSIFCHPGGWQKQLQQLQSEASLVGLGDCGRFRFPTKIHLIFGFLRRQIENYQHWDMVLSFSGM